MRSGPTYLLIASDDRTMMRLVLTGLNSWGREWDETIFIEGDEEVGNEVGSFKHLQHRLVAGVVNPNVVIAFEDDPMVTQAQRRGIPTYVFRPAPPYKHLLNRPK